MTDRYTVRLGTDVTSEGSCWVASIDGVDGLLAQGDTPQGALRALASAWEAWLGYGESRSVCTAATYIGSAGVER